MSLIILFSFIKETIEHTGEIYISRQDISLTSDITVYECIFNEIKGDTSLKISFSTEEHRITIHSCSFVSCSNNVNRFGTIDAADPLYITIFGCCFSDITANFGAIVRIISSDSSKLNEYHYLYFISAIRCKGESPLVFRRMKTDLRNKQETYNANFSHCTTNSGDYGLLFYYDIQNDIKYTNIENNDCISTVLSFYDEGYSDYIDGFVLFTNFIGNTEKSG